MKLDTVNGLEKADAPNYDVIQAMPLSTSLTTQLVLNSSVQNIVHTLLDSTTIIELFVFAASGDALISCVHDNVDRGVSLSEYPKAHIRAGERLTYTTVPRDYDGSVEGFERQIYFELSNLVVPDGDVYVEIREA